jgi:hypothetical protein
LQAKLAAAVSIVRTGVDVVITQCGTDTAAKFVMEDCWGKESIWDIDAGTLLTTK